jgi:hypothetical protein
MTTEIVHAALRSVRLKSWLSRDGDSITLAVPGANEPLRFREQEPESVPSAPSNWEILDRVLRSSGR